MLTFDNIFWDAFHKYLEVASLLRKCFGNVDRFDEGFYKVLQ